MKHLPYDRSERVADAIYQIVVQALRSELRDPRLEGVEITRVRMTRDLRITRVYYYMINATEERQKLALKGFKSSSGYLKKHIGEIVNLRFMPEIEFFYDESIDIVEKIDELLKGKDQKG